jgi:predicted PurR-regulated permease PerM
MATAFDPGPALETRPPQPAVNWRSVLPLAAGLALGLGVLYAVWYLARPIAILLLAVTVGEALEPLVTRLQRRMSRGLAIVVVYLVLGLLTAGLIWLVAPQLSAQFNDIRERVPVLIERFQQQLTQWNAALGGMAERFVSGSTSGMARSAVGVPLKFATGMLELLLVVFLSAYWLLGGPATRGFFLSLLPPERRAHAGDVLSEMGHAMGGYVRGTAISAVIMGALAWLGLSLIGMPYALVFGVLTMLGEPIPFVGPIIVGALVTLVALTQSVTTALLALGLFVLLQQIEGNIVTPNVMRRETRSSQALVIFALLAGAAVGGLLGAIVAIPLAGALQVLVLRVVAPAIRRRTGAVDAEASVH